jgi:hypothetical protein
MSVLDIDLDLKIEGLCNILKNNLFTRSRFKKILAPAKMFWCSVADPDPGSGAFLPPGSGIRNEAIVGSGISKQNLLIAFIQK